MSDAAVISIDVEKVTWLHRTCVVYGPTECRGGKAKLVIKYSCVGTVCAVTMTTGELAVSLTTPSAAICLICPTEELQSEIFDTFGRLAEDRVP